MAGSGTIQTGTLEPVVGDFDNIRCVGYENHTVFMETHAALSRRGKLEISIIVDTTASSVFHHSNNLFSLSFVITLYTICGKKSS
jgi:hypothetical protein